MGITKKPHHDPETGEQSWQITFDFRTPLSQDDVEVLKAALTHTVKGSTNPDYGIADVERALTSGAWSPTEGPQILKQIEHLRLAIRSTCPRSTVAVAGMRLGRLVTEAIAKTTWPIVTDGRTVKRARKSGGDARGKQIAEHAKKHDADIRKWFRSWLNSDRLRDEFRSPVGFIRSKNIRDLDTKKIQRRLSIIDPNWRRKSRQ